MPTDKIVYRRLDGLLLLDKPQGMSSNAALQAVRRLLRAEKGGHTGSLDPLATGMLPLCFGEATKIAGQLLGADKAYLAEVRLGQTTDTDDAEGQLLRERPLPALDRARVEAALRPLTGCIDQRAPVYSALKQGGEPLYARARRGEVIEAPVRRVQVHAIELLACAPPLLQLRIRCGSGTYIRSLARDLGEALGCGAHITALRRLWVEPFAAEPMYTLAQLQARAEQGAGALEACVLPLAASLAGFLRLDLGEDEARRFRHGQRLRDRRVGAGLWAVFGPGAVPLGLGRGEDGGRLSPQRLFVPAGD